MRIRRLTLSHFRSVAEGEIIFPDHTVIIGGNSVGKSTMCEALDLLLGPDRLARPSPVDEHDFHERRYLDADGNPIPIKLEVILTGLTDDVLTRFRMHREYWPIFNKISRKTAKFGRSVDGMIFFISPAPLRSATPGPFRSEGGARAEGRAGRCAFRALRPPRFRTETARSLWIRA